jgi:AcrR family transcriptional regulator
VGQQQRYHHGDLRRALLAEAVKAIAESGSHAVSLRDLARRIGVSHAAPQHHFGDKAGLLTAIAAEGFELLARALEESGDDLLDAGVAYVRFATSHQAHFEVMFTPALYHADSPEVATARERAGQVLAARVPKGSRREGRLAAWSIVHGFATLWLSGALTDIGDDPATAARPVIGLLFR